MTATNPQEKKMTNFNYKKYSLENLENWIHDAISCSEASSQEIYNTIKNVVEEQYLYYKDGESRTRELLNLLNGQVTFNVDPAGNIVDTMENFDIPNSGYSYDSSDYCRSSWNSFWEEDSIKSESKKWNLPLQFDEETHESYVNFPPDLLQEANLKGGDWVKWVDNHDGSFTLKKVKNPT